MRAIEAPGRAKCSGPRPIAGRRRAILEYIYDFTLDNGFQPSTEEIGAEFGIIPKNVRVHLFNLACAGWIDFPKGKARAIRFRYTPEGERFAGFVTRRDA